MEALYRSETAICALSSKNLAWDSWALDSLTAMGMAAIRNPLGDRLIHFINSPSGPKAFEITMMLSTKLIADGGDKLKTADQAFQAFEYWNGRHCLHCGGRGVLDFEQTECGRCGGTGDRPIPSEYSEPVRKAISLLIEAENYMENQLRARLAPCYVPSPVYVVAAPVMGEDDEDFIPPCGQATLVKTTKSGGG